MHCPRELIRMGMATKPAIVIDSALVFVETESALSAKVPSIHCSPHIMRFLRYRGRIASRETHSVAIGGNAQRGIPGKLLARYKRRIWGGYGTCFSFTPVELSSFYRCGAQSALPL